MKTSPPAVVMLLCLWWPRTVMPLTTPMIRIPKLVLLDRDGVVNQDVGAPGVTSSSQLRLTPSAAQAIGRLQEHGCIVVLVTNQSCVGKGLISEIQLKEIHDHLVQLLLPHAKLDRIYFCTSIDDAKARYKPAPGMLMEAMKDYGIEDPSDTVMIGDTYTDMQAAAAAGVVTKILVSTGYGSSLMDDREPDECTEYIDKSSSVAIPEGTPDSILPFYYTKNLATAVKWLLAVETT